MTITTATATRQGTETNNADSAVVFRSLYGTVGAALIDIAGHSPNAPFVSRLCAETAARITAQQGGLPGILTAGLLVADPGAGDTPEPNGVAVVAAAYTDGETRITWIGDSHAYAWDDDTLTRLTTPHNWAEQLRAHFQTADADLTERASDVLTTALATATPATALTVRTKAPLILLASDGLDALTHDQLADLVTAHADDPQRLADTLVAAPSEDEDGYRDDVTVIVIRHT